MENMQIGMLDRALEIKSAYICCPFNHADVMECKPGIL